VWSNLLYTLALIWILGILILQNCSLFALCLIPYLIFFCFQASEWKPINRSLTWRARLSSKFGQNTNWPEQHIRTNTHIIFKPEPNETLVSVFLMSKINSAMIPFTFFFFFFFFSRLPLVNSHMNNNSISGQIPPELSRLPNLFHL
jgi:hypothetical protein